MPGHSRCRFESTEYVEYVEYNLIVRYDIDNSGAIDRDEMINVMRAIYSMVDGNVSEAIRGSTMEKVIAGRICECQSSMCAMAGPVPCGENIRLD